MHLWMRPKQNLAGYKLALRNNKSMERTCSDWILPIIDLILKMRDSLAN